MNVFGLANMIILASQQLFKLQAGVTPLLALRFPSQSKISMFIFRHFATSCGYVYEREGQMPILHHSTIAKYIPNMDNAPNVMTIDNGKAICDFGETILHGMSIIRSINIKFYRKNAVITLCLRDNAEECQNFKTKSG